MEKMLFMFFLPATVLFKLPCVIFIWFFFCLTFSFVLLAKAETEHGNGNRGGCYQSSGRPSALTWNLLRAYLSFQSSDQLSVVLQEFGDFQRYLAHCPFKEKKLPSHPFPHILSLSKWKITLCCIWSDSCSLPLILSAPQGHRNITNFRNHHYRFFKAQLGSKAAPPRTVN